MFDFRRLRNDVLALVLLGVVAFVGLCLVSWDSADPPSTKAYPVREVAQNLGGTSGAYLSYGLRTLFGVGAYFVWLSILAIDVRLFTRREIQDWGVVVFGWSLLLAAVCLGLQLLVPGLAGGQIVGSGGYVGAWGVALMLPLFSKAGLMIFLGACAASGMLLAGDVLFVDAALDFFAAPMWIANWVRFGKLKPAKEKISKKKAEAPLAVRESNSLEAVIEVATPPTTAEQAADSAVELLDVMNAEIAAALGEVMEPVSTEAVSAPANDGERKPFKVNPPVNVKSDRDQVIAQLDAMTQADGSKYEMPSLELLEHAEAFPYEELAKKAQIAAVTLEKTFQEFGLNVKVNEIDTGPVITQFELSLEAGLRLNKVVALENDLAIGLRVPAVRVVAPIPGKNTVGVEVPNEKQVMVRLRELIEACPQDIEKKRIPLFLGKDVAGRPMIVDLTKMPHLLIAGRTGTGKSVCLNTLILSILMTRSPDQVRMLMIDPKMVELSPYKRIPHLMHPVITDMKKAEAVLGWAVEKMEERYDLLARCGVRHLDSYNQLSREDVLRRCGIDATIDSTEADLIPEQMPYIVIIADEMADMMMTSGKDVEAHIIRLAQKSRAVGIHLVLATQKPTVDVITGLIKSNLPARIAFQVASRTDSRVVLDENGADRLLGNGDMLFLVPGTSNLIRAQGTYVSDNEVNRIIDHFGDQTPQYSAELAQVASKSVSGEATGGGGSREKDDMYEPAVEIIIREGRGSVSLLQRHLGIGYGRAARLIDYMAEDGIVGDYNGSQAREVLYNLEQWDAIKANQVPMDSIA